MSAFFLNICVKFLTFSLFCGISCLEVRYNTYNPRNLPSQESRFIFGGGCYFLKICFEFFSFLLTAVLNALVLVTVVYSYVIAFHFVTLFYFMQLHFIYLMQHCCNS